MIYTIDEISRRIQPVASAYGLRAVYLFGSYARGEATENSDIELLIDTSGTNLRSLFSLGKLYCDLESALEKKLDTQIQNKHWFYIIQMNNKKKS